MRASAVIMWIVVPLLVYLYFNGRVEDSGLVLVSVFCIAAAVVVLRQGVA